MSTCVVQSRARPQTGLLLRAKNCKLFGSAQSAEKRQRKNDPRKLTLTLTLTRTLTLTLTLTPTLTLALHLTLALTLTPNLKLTLTRTLVKTIEKSFRKKSLPNQPYRCARNDDTAILMLSYAPGRQA